MIFPAINRHLARDLPAEHGAHDTGNTLFLLDQFRLPFLVNQHITSENGP